MTVQFRRVRHTHHFVLALCFAILNDWCGSRTLRGCKRHYPENGTRLTMIPSHNNRYKKIVQVMAITSMMSLFVALTMEDRRVFLEISFILGVIALMAWIGLSLSSKKNA